MQNYQMTFTKIQYLRGPNIWTYRPALEVWVDIGELEDAPSNTLPGFYERLTAWLPSLIEHRCGVGERGGFLERLREGTWAGHILEHVTLELQTLAGMPTGFGKARQTSRPGLYKVVVRSPEEQVSRACLEAARNLILAAIHDMPFDVDACVARLRELVDERCLGPSTTAIVKAAQARGIPFMRLNEGSLVQLGYSCRQHRIWTAETDQTSAIAESICGDKELTKSLLSACGIPVPEGRVAPDADDAWEAAQSLGLPVVVKPIDGNHGRGVSTNLYSQDEIAAAWKLADAEGSEVIVERFIPGNEHRLLVVGGALVAAARGEVAYVVGNGQETIRQLIDSQLNRDPRRGATEDYPLNLILPEEDPAVVLELERQKVTTETIPADGQKILIQRNGNVAFDVTAQVHQDVAADAVLAAKVVGLDIAGIDLVATDISRPLREQGGGIVEVNAGPGLLMHLKPAEGEPRPVGQAIVNSLFAAEDNGRIPVIGVGGTADNSLLAQVLAHILELDRRQCGVACSKGLFINRRQLAAGNQANWSSGRKLLLNPGLNAAIIESSLQSILDEGLAYDRSSVAVVTQADPEMRLPDYFIENEDQLFSVIRTLVDVVLDSGVAVLNADEPLVLRMASLCDGETILLSEKGKADALADHCQQGGRAVFIRENQVCLATGSSETGLIKLEKRPSGMSPLDMLAAIGAAWALNIPEGVIRAGFETL